jgi:hypothetical protein
VIDIDKELEWPRVGQKCVVDVDWVEGLLAEVKQLRGLLMKGSGDYTTSYTDLRKIIEDVHLALIEDDWHCDRPDDARITNALGILSEVIG